MTIYSLASSENVDYLISLYKFFGYNTYIGTPYFILGSENLSTVTERSGLVGENDGATFSVGHVTNGAKAALPSAAVNARKVCFEIVVMSIKEVEYT